MYQIEQFDKRNLHFYRLKGNASYVDVCPERGGMVTAFHTADEDVLFMNDATLFDLSKNVRGGIPVLFPIAGQLTDKKYAWHGKTYTMANHGLVRTRALTVAGKTSDAQRAALTLSFSATAETKASYPFDFELLLTYELAGGKLSIHEKISNKSSEQMPVYPGYHPYFNIGSKQVSLKSKATKYLDYNDNKEKPFNGAIDLNGLKESVVLLDGADTQIVAAFNEGKKLVIDQDPKYKYTVLWVQGDAHFVCIEPWTAKTNALNDDPDGLILVDPDEPLNLAVSFHLENR
ncbi:aldose epimerase [Sporolactobacillus vineae]|uniref:aldose epimerase family protein n=1 Tax=Sporolactobacillus vineae TaxID=444463 RepID=UPI00028820D7|nr:aldose epimerase [Sporolactobacillus vineae]